MKKSRQTLCFIKKNPHNIIYTSFLIMEIALILLFFFLMLNRIKYGVDFSDESWYVAEPYAVAEMGAIPFVNNVSQSPGFAFPLALVFKLFCVLNGGTDGIVFFSRILFIIVSFLVACITVFIINKNTPLKLPLITIIPLFLASNTGYSLYAINYHTIGLIYLPLIIAFVYAEYDDNSVKSIKWGFLSGVFAARAVLGTVQIIIALFIIFTSLCFQKKIKRILGILLGWFLSFFIIICFISFQYGFESLIIWVKMYLNQGYFLIGNLWNLEKSIKGLRLLFKYAFVMLIILSVTKLLLKRNIFELFLKITVLLLITIGVFYSIRRNDHLGILITRISWFLPILYGIFLINTNTSNKHILIICLSYLSIYFLVSYTTVSGFGQGKAYWLVLPILMSIIMVFNTSYNELKPKIINIINNIIKVWVICAILLIGLFKIWAEYSFVYRDDKISKLSYKIEKGIWRGLYTSKKRAICIVDAEKYLKSITHKDDYILCLDWASFGYLMINGKICSPTTLDASHYSYNINTPNPYYMYFSAVNRVPDKIIYIDYGHDKIVSIDNPKWKFNEFVNSFYQEQRRYSNELFKIREYTVFNYEDALKTVKEEADFNWL